MSTSVPTNRRIKFLARNLPFPTDPTFREFRVVQELTGISAQDIMTGNAGVWMLPALAIVALMRDKPDIPRGALEKVLDLSPGDFELEGDFDTEDDAEDPTTAAKEAAPTGTESTVETPVSSGTPDSPTTSPEQQESQTT